MILKFEGHYHGWLDPSSTAQPDPSLAGPAGAPIPVPGTLGRPLAAGLIIAPWNDLVALSELMDRHTGRIAAGVCEPVTGRRIRPPLPHLLHQSRRHQKLPPLGATDRAMMSARTQHSWTAE
ncbi:hypothetical protein ACIBO5_56140 [Nonomuraea angiospora]|uniref:hypothetical protein n=1 Tax=Nonomuraea angiospora TaxID=46172 RepID=UPI0029BE307D|nr:hypothetical protein [Nonomuraea angiospora]MDX3101510.1 hypothetical protein [Nonomuraea angiospora]